MGHDETLVSEAAIEGFRENGYLVRQGFYSSEEIELLSRVARSDARARSGHGRGGALSEGRKAELWAIPFAGGDEPESPNRPYDAVCFGHRLVETFRGLLVDHERYPDDDVTIHHRKLVMKDADSFNPDDERFGGNRFMWHQDYVYWGDGTATGGDAYGGPGRPFPDMATAFIAIDPVHRGNGCLQFLAGSHRLGLLDFEVEQWGERRVTDRAVEAAQDSGCELVTIELDPGSAVFFHSQLLHRSAANSSNDPRWALLCTYDTMHNVPTSGPDHRRPPVVVADTRVVEEARRHLEFLTGSTGAPMVSNESPSRSQSTEEEQQVGGTTGRW